MEVIRNSKPQETSRNSAGKGISRPVHAVMKCLWETSKYERERGTSVKLACGDLYDDKLYLMGRRLGHSPTTSSATQKKSSQGTRLSRNQAFGLFT